MKALDFPVERRVGAWLVQVRVDEAGTLASFVVEGSWDEVERLTQRIYWTHPASMSAVWQLSVEEFAARFPAILDEDPESGSGRAPKGRSSVESPPGT